PDGASVREEPTGGRPEGAGVRDDPTGGRPEGASVFDQETRTWAKRPTPPPEDVPTAPPRKPSRWLVAVAGLVAVVVVAAVVGVLLSRGSPAPKNPRPTPTLQNPSAALAARLAPRDVEVVNEQPTTVTIRWVDPNNGTYPLVVQWSGHVQKTTGNTQTVVAGLDPSRGYCFVIAAVYGVGGETADAAPVCIRGATPPTTHHTEAR
ncbi:MAG: hypothetical protein FWC87_10200, partial [Acidimicrobiaceae bacterium]|nr:hypothetical protein [Acidimicrobiaceae bacterium]